MQSLLWSIIGMKIILHILSKTILKQFSDAHTSIWFGILHVELNFYSELIKIIVVEKPHSTLDLQLFFSLKETIFYKTN